MSLSRKEFLLSLLVSTTALLSGCQSGTETDPQPGTSPVLVSATEIRSFTREQMAQQVQRINPALSFITRYGIKVYKVVYNTTLPDGSPVKASGALLVPDAPTAVPMVSQQHGTILSDSDAPSNFGSGSDAALGGSLFASIGYILACPDYIGYGESKDRPHPYEHRQSLAQASLDMLRASKEYIQKNNVRWDERLFLTGYSEGGYATMALQKLLEEQFPTEFNLRASSLGAGAYHKTATMKHLINERTDGIGTYNRLYLWALTTYNDMYKDLRRPLSAYLKEPYATQVQQGSASVSVSLNETFTDAFKKGVNDGTDKAFLAAVADNDVYDWKPKTPTRLYHGDADNLVFYFNSKDAYDAMQKRGATNVQLITLRNRNHTSAITDYLLGTYEMFSTVQ